MPSAIISATAAATTIVGMIGSRGSFGDPSFARAMLIFLREQHALASRSRRWSAPRRPEPRAGCTHQGGSSRRVEHERADDDDRADDEDQEGGRPVADVEAGKVEPAGAALGREARPSPSNSVCAPQRGQIAAQAPTRAGERLGHELGVRSAVDRRAPAAPHVDRGEQEQPHDVDEMPVPGGRLEAEMLPAA